MHTRVTKSPHVMCLALAGLLVSVPTAAAAGLQWEAGVHRFQYENSYRSTGKTSGEAEKSYLLGVRAEFALHLQTAPGRLARGKAVLTALELGDKQGRWTRLERVPGTMAQVGVEVSADGRLTFVDALVAYHHERRYWLARAPSPFLAMPVLPRDPTKIVSSVLASVHPRTGKVQSSDSSVGRQRLTATKIPVTAPVVELLPRGLLQALVVPAAELASGGSTSATTTMLALRFEATGTVGTSVRFSVEGEGITPTREDKHARVPPGGVRSHIQARGSVEPGTGRLHLLAGALDVAVPVGDTGLVTTHSAFNLSRR